MHIYHLANEIALRLKEKEENLKDINIVKLQKLCYFCYVSSVVNNVKLLNEHFLEPFDCWMTGPVNPLLYYTFRDEFRNEKNVITLDKINSFAKLYSKKSLTLEQKKIIDLVLNKIGHYENEKLYKLSTVKNSPFDITRSGKTILNEDVKKFYTKENGYEWLFI